METIYLLKHSFYSSTSDRLVTSRTQDRTSSYSNGRGEVRRRWSNPDSSSRRPKLETGNRRNWSRTRRWTMTPQIPDKSSRYQCLFNLSSRWRACSINSATAAPPVMSLASSSIYHVVILLLKLGSNKWVNKLGSTLQNTTPLWHQNYSSQFYFGNGSGVDFTNGHFYPMQFPLLTNATSLISSNPFSLFLSPSYLPYPLVCFTRLDFTSILSRFDVLLSLIAINWLN